MIREKESEDWLRLGWPGLRIPFFLLWYLFNWILGEDIYGINHVGSVSCFLESDPDSYFPSGSVFFLVGGRNRIHIFLVKCSGSGKTEPGSGKTEPGSVKTEPGSGKTEPGSATLGVRRAGHKPIRYHKSREKCLEGQRGSGERGGWRGEGMGRGKKRGWEGEWRVERGGVSKVADFLTL